MTIGEAIDVLDRNYPDKHFGILCDAVDMAIKALEGQNDGEWIPVTNERGGHECSKCHSYAPSYQSGDEMLTNYCPNCGAKMEMK